MLGVFLYRMSTGMRFQDIQLETGTGLSTVNRAYHLVLNRLVPMRQAIDIAWPTPEQRAKHSAEMVAKYGPMFENCIGIMDGSEITIPRPTVDQRAWYSGRYHHHCVKMQAVVSMNERFYGVVAGV